MIAWWLAACLAVQDLVPPTADQDPGLPQVTLEVAGHVRAVHLQTWGDPDDPAALLLHGSLSDHRALLPLADALADDHHVVAWDQRGNGLSERIPADEYTLDAVVDEIDQVAALASPDAPVDLVGHSFGAMYAVLYAGRHPDRVRDLVLVEPAGLTGEIFDATFADTFHLDLLGPDLSATYWQNAVLSPDQHAAMDLKALLLLESGEQLAYFCDPDNPPAWPVWRPGAYVEWVRGGLLREPGAGFTHDFTVGLDLWTGRTLLVGSTCSALGCDFQAQWHAPLFDPVELACVPDAGHRLPAEQPDTLAALVTAFLSTSPP